MAQLSWVVFRQFPSRWWISKKARSGCWRLHSSHWVPTHLLRLCLALLCSYFFLTVRQLNFRGCPPLLRILVGPQSEHIAVRASRSMSDSRCHVESTGGRVHPCHPLPPSKGDVCHTDHVGPSCQIMMLQHGHQSVMYPNKTMGTRRQMTHPSIAHINAI